MNKLKLIAFFIIVSTFLPVKTLPINAYDEETNYCRIDADCKDFICTMVVGQDTPQCGPDNKCICGPAQNLKQYSLLERLLNIPVLFFEAFIKLIETTIGNLIG